MGCTRVDEKLDRKVRECIVDDGGVLDDLKQGVTSRVRGRNGLRTKLDWVKTLNKIIV